MSKHNKVTFDEEEHPIDDANGNYTEMGISELDDPQVRHSGFQSMIGDDGYLRRSDYQPNYVEERSFIGEGAPILAREEWVPNKPRMPYRLKDKEEQRNYRMTVDKWGNGWPEALAARKANPKVLKYNPLYVDKDHLDKLKAKVDSRGNHKWIVEDKIDYDGDGIPDIGVFDARTGRVKAFNGLSFQRDPAKFDLEYRTKVAKGSRKLIPPSKYFFEQKFGGEYDDLGEITEATRGKVKGAYEEYKSLNKGRKMPRVGDLSAYQFYVKTFVEPLSRALFAEVKYYNSEAKREGKQTINIMGEIAQAQAVFYYRAFAALLLKGNELQILMDTTLPTTKADCVNRAGGITDESNPELKKWIEKMKERNKIKKSLSLVKNRRLLKGIIHLIVTNADPSLSTAYRAGFLRVVMNFVNGNEELYNNVISNLREIDESMAASLQGSMQLANDFFNNADGYVKTLAQLASVNLPKVIAQYGYK